MLIAKIISSKPNNLIKLFLVINLILGFSVSVRAEEREKVDSNGMPTHRRDGGSRAGDNCIANGDNLVALIPENTVALNASTSPKLFFYVPEISNQKMLEFVLRNEEDELMYEAFITTNGRGIISVEVPAEVKANLLETNRNYHWYLSMICNSQQRSRDVVVQGWMRQDEIQSNIKKQLDSSTAAVEKAQIYHEQGFWYDALSVLADSQQNYGKQAAVTAKWSELLESVGLGELAAKPFVNTQLIKDSALSQK